MRFDAFKARRNHPEYLILLAYSLAQLDDQFLIHIRHNRLLGAG
jgi:hypothetical protein